jgi:tRNA-specific 2-thiouridylase
LVDLWQGRGSRDYEIDDIMLLKVGRHLRPKGNYKLIIARDEGECQYLEGYRKQYTSIQSVSHNGPLALIDGKIELEDYNHAASIVARYGQGRNADNVEMTFALPNARAQSIMVQPLTTDQVLKEWHV